MTLSRQLFTGIAAVFVALMLGIVTIYVVAAKDSLERQLDAHANETATSLALSLGSRFGTLEASALQVMVNPLFDRGHFESIAVLAPNGERIFGRELGARALDVPGWFAALVTLQGPSGEALVSAGWRQLGKVVVRVHPGYAYRQLYDTALATLLWLALLFGLALAAMRYHLGGILRPLREIETAAIAISNRDFVSIDSEPRTRELQRVTHAINSLSAKIRAAIAHEAERAEGLRRQAFEDPLSGQLNRRGFEQAVASSIGEGGEIHSGVLALFSLSGLEEINRVFSLSRGDAIVRQLAAALAAPGAHALPIVGRWQGPTLAAFLPNATPDAGLAWARDLCGNFAASLQALALPAGAGALGGLVHFSGEARFERLAAAAEDALAQAGRQGAGAVVLARADAAAGAVADLKTQIEDCIAGDRFTLLGQNVVALAGRGIFQIEILSRLAASDGAPIAAAAFVPAASRHGLLPGLDAKVLERTVRLLESGDSLPPTVSVNVSMQSIADPPFRAALRALLAGRKDIAGRLAFEVTGYTASRSLELTREFARDVRAQGAQFALDNFDIDPNSMAIVHELLPAYIKLAAAFTLQIGAREDLQLIVEAMVRMLRPLEIALIAQGVEDRESLGVLERLGLGGYQGYVDGRPHPLPVPAGDR